MRRLGLVAVTLLATGCVTAKVTRLVPTEYAPVPPEQVTVLVDISELLADTIRYERIAVINLSGDDFTNQAQMLTKAREEAGKLGANAVIMIGYRREFEWLSDGIPDTGSAIAIRYEIMKDTTIFSRYERP